MRFVFSNFHDLGWNIYRKAWFYMFSPLRITSRGYPTGPGELRAGAAESLQSRAERRAGLFRLCRWGKKWL